MQNFSQNKGERSFGRCRNILFQLFFLFRTKCAFFNLLYFKTGFPICTVLQAKRRRKGKKVQREGNVVDLVGGMFQVGLKQLVLISCRLFFHLVLFWHRQQAEKPLPDSDGVCHAATPKYPSAA